MSPFTQAIMCCMNSRCPLRVLSPTHGMPKRQKKKKKFKYLGIWDELDKTNTYPRVALDRSFHLSHELFKTVGLSSTYCNIQPITSIRDTLAESHRAEKTRDVGGSKFIWGRELCVQLSSCFCLRDNALTRGVIGTKKAHEPDLKDCSTLLPPWSATTRSPSLLKETEDGRWSPSMLAGR